MGAFVYVIFICGFIDVLYTCRYLMCNCSVYEIMQNINMNIIKTTVLFDCLYTG